MRSVTPAAIQSVRYRFGDFSIDGHAPELLHAGRAVALEAKAREVLLHPIKHRDETVSKDELFEACWPGRIVTEGTLAKASGPIKPITGGSNRAVCDTERSMHE